MRNREGGASEDRHSDVTPHEGIDVTRGEGVGKLAAWGPPKPGDTTTNGRQPPGEDQVDRTAHVHLCTGGGGNLESGEDVG